MNRTRTRTLFAAAVLATAGLNAPAAQALDTTKGYTGPCLGADKTTGVTIVIDFQELNGNGGVAAPTLVRCSPNATPGTSRTGVKALQDAGFALTGTQQYGLSFICRIEGRPSATETVPDGHIEKCGRTPPASAYWGYWHAAKGATAWTYSNTGAATRNVTPGGSEGWSFSVNKTATTNPPPRVAPAA